MYLYNLIYFCYLVVLLLSAVVILMVFGKYIVHYTRIMSSVTRSIKVKLLLIYHP